MNRHPNQITLLWRGKKLNDECKLCFGAAVGCSIVGTGGWLVNLVAPGTTLLHGLLVVAGFYFATGVINLLKRSETETERPDSLCDSIALSESIGERKTDKERLKSAA